jgi:L-lactate dehydrogenase complex protein LldE
MDQPDRVALCVTCVVDQLMPEVGVATVKVLRRAGHQVDFPVAQTCCGQPFFNSGFRQRAADLAKRTIEIFEPYPVVVLPSGSCTTMIRLEYAHLLEDQPEWHERAKQLAAKTYELSEFLVKQGKWPPKGKDVGINEGPQASSGGGLSEKMVTYHDSCHMCRMLHLKEEPRRMLTESGCSIHEMSEPDRCCGFGGLFSIRMPEVSTAMTAEKLRQATETGAEFVVTADPGCLMQMRELAGEDGPSIRHLAIVLEEMTR